MISLTLTNHHVKSQVELHRVKGKPINTILDECLKDEDWLATVSVLQEILNLA